MAPIVDPPLQSDQRLLPNGQILTINNLRDFLISLGVSTQRVEILEWPDLKLVCHLNITTLRLRTYLGVPINTYFIDQSGYQIFLSNNTLYQIPIAYLQSSDVNNPMIINYDTTIQQQFFETYFAEKWYILIIYKRPGMIYDPNVAPPGLLGTAYQRIYQPATIE